MRLPGLKPTALALALAGAMFFVACGGDSDDDSTPEPTDTAEPTATADNGDGNGDGNGGGDGLVGGMEVGEYFALNCAACHGQEREGLVGPALLPDVLTEDDAFYADTIANGRAGTSMPAWADTGLSSEEIDTLVAFIRTEP